jgi:hypothetical protein
MAPLVSWRQTSLGGTAGVAVQRDGTLWLSGVLSPSGSVTFSPQFFLQNTNASDLSYIARLNVDGTPVSIVAAVTNVHSGHLAVDGRGNLLSAWTRWDALGVYVRKHDSTGNLLWEQAFDANQFESLISDKVSGLPATGYGQNSLVVTADGQLLVASYFANHVVGSSGSDFGAVIRELDANGEVVAQRILRTTAINGISLAGIDVAPDGTVIAAGSFTGRLTIDDVSVDASGSDIFVARFHLLPVQLPTLSWTRTSDGVTLTWPAGFVLQTTFSLNQADWQDHAGSSPLTISPASSARFFRLRSE